MSTEFNGIFPEARLDEMRKAAKDFDPRNPGHVEWDLRGTNGKLDASESAFVARQLEYMRPGIFETKFPKLKGKSLVPINSSMDPGAETFVITKVTEVGQVKLMKDWAKDLSRVEVDTSQASMGVFSMGISYGYTVNEARAAMFARVPLQQRKAATARELMARKLDDILFSGETTTGVKGLINQTGTLVYTVPSNGAGGTKTWSTKSPDNVLLDLNGAPQKMVVDSLDTEYPNTMVLPLSRFNAIAGTRVGDGTSETILSYWLRTNPYGISSVEYTTKLETAGDSTTARGVVYDKNPNVLECIVPIEFEQFAPETVNTEIITICHMRVGGVALYRPKALCYLDGI